MKIRTAIKPPEQITYGAVTSPVGKLLLGFSQKGEICRVSFLRGLRIHDVVAQWQSEWKSSSFKKGKVAENYAKQPILMVGTEFQQAVWRAMTEVPPGKVTTYGDIADHIGRPKAFRAVGAACGANPVVYLVPCHRVLAANGRLGGFSGGLDMKVDLLTHEGFIK